jgi:hypothetical protein
LLQQMTNGASPASEPFRRALHDAEGRMATAMEQLVAGKGFTALLGQAAQNAVALTTLNAELWDMVLRNLRVAGRSDIHGLGRRLNAIEDKLEVILQEVETLADDGPPARRGA